MSSEEYHKARYTGIADMSKAGAAEGLMARKREQDVQQQDLQSRQQHSAEMTNVGHKIGVFLILSFPYLVAFALGLAPGMYFGERLELGQTFEDFPIWYQLLVLPLPFALTALLFWFRRIAIPVFYALLIAGVVFYIVVLAP